MVSLPALVRRSVSSSSLSARLRKMSAALAAAAALCFVPLGLHASTFTVTSTADNASAGTLRWAIGQANTAGGTNTIAFSVTGIITLTGELPVIQDDGLTIDGTTAPGYAGTPLITIDGGSAYRCMFVGAWTSGTSTQVAENVTIAALNFQNCSAVGGAGGGGFNATGGGGAGLGGAIFVADLANVTLSNVTFANNSAIGGAGGLSNGNDAPSGGGGMGGNGGGFNGVGGAGGGGGLGIGANGGSANGTSGAAGIATGAAAGGAPAICAGISGTGGSNGGGGGGIQATSCGAGGGGVGGGAGVAFSAAGAGGFGGGGGAGYLVSGGAGGFGGGGGGEVGVGSAAGAGGFGGGAGGATGGGTAGAAGFGGGSGVSASGANLAPGGGGMGAGGAVFIQQGGTLDLTGPLTETGSSVTGGASGGSGAGNGWAVGTGMFIQGNNTVIFSPGAGQTETFGGIADQTGSGGTGGNAGAGGVTMNGAGTLVLNGVNTYTGPTTVASGTLDVNGSLSASTTVTVNNGATLGGSGTINGNVILLGDQATIDNSGGIHINGTTTTWLFDASAGTPQAAYVSTAFVTPLTVMVTANGAGVSGLTVNFTTPGAGASATLSAASCVTNGSGSCSVTATANTTPGNYAITASVNGYSGLGSVMFTLANTVPTLVVTSTGDDAGRASNCTFQLSPVAGTDASCSLRDALLESASVGAASIFFDSTKFATATTIRLTNGTLNIPSNTAILGAMSGSGTALKNLVTISGGGSSSNFSIFTVNAGVTGATIGDLTLANGNVNSQGGAIDNLGSLTVGACTFSNNYAGGYVSGLGNGGGAIYNDGTLAITSSTFSGNTSAPGGAITVNSGQVLIDNSTFSGNSAIDSKVGGAIFINNGAVTVNDSTFSGNSAAGGGAIYNYGTLAASNTILTGNTGGDCGAGGSSPCPSNGSNGNVIGVGATSLSSLGSYGGPTQTMIPLPGSAAICAGSATEAVSAGLAFDQRGVPTNLNPSNPGSYTGVGGYCPAGSLDAGAVQTDYTLSFSTEPEPISPATSIAPGANFQAAVTLDESGSAFTAGSVSIPLSLTTGGGTLSNGTASTSGGVATYSTLQVSAAGSNDQLTANLTLNTSPAVSISAASSSFTVVVSAASTVTATSSAVATFSPSAQSVTLSATVLAGSSAATTGTVTFTVKSGATVIGTATTSGTLTSSGTASVSYSLPAGTQAGAYTIDAEYNGGTGFAASGDTSHQLTIGKATPTISTAPTASTITYGQTLASSTLSGGAASYNSATVLGAFAFTTPTTAPNADTFPESVTFTPTDNTDYNTATGTVSVLVLKAVATIAVTGYKVPFDGNAHTATGTATGVGGANLNADLTLSGTTHTNAGIYTDSWSFTDPTGNYVPQSNTVTDTIQQIPATVAFTSAPPAIAYQGGSFTPALTYSGDGTASVVSQTPAVCTVSAGVVNFVSGGTCTLTPSTTAGVNYAAAVGTAQSFWVGPTQAIGSASSTLTATVTITTAGTLGQINILTQGAPSKDFALVSGGTCATGTAYTVNQTCTVEFTFTPSWPGQRLGAITLTTGSSSSATVLGTAFVYGLGTGPLAVFPGSTNIRSLGGGFRGSEGVSVDSSGNVYVADTGNNEVKKIVAVNGSIPSSPIILTLGSGFSGPTGVTVDGSGNVFVSDTNNNNVKEIVAVHGVIPSSPTILTLGSGFVLPTGITVDGSGNVYVADTHNSRVKEIVAVNGVIPSNPTVLTLGSGFNNPTGVAVDRSGNVYVADIGNAAVKEIVAVNGAIPSSPTILTLGGGFSNPTGITVDGSGNVYVADESNSTVKEIVAVNGNIPSSPTILSLGSGFSQPFGVAVDGSGGIFVADSGNEAVKEIDLTKAPALTFANTATGQTSTDSPKSVTVQNMGNQPLTFSSFAASVNFALNTGTCSTSTPLAESGTCTVAASFTPTTAGSPDTGTLTLTDNSLNATAATQAIALSGTATAPASTQTLVSPAGTTFSPASQTVMLSAAVTAGTQPATSGTVTFTLANGSTTICSTTSATLDSSGVANVSCTLPAALPVGNYPIKAVYNPGTGYVTSSDSTHQLTVSKATPTIATLPTASAITYGQTLASSKLSGGVATVGGTAVAGTFTFTTPATVPGAGTPSESITFTPSDTADELTATGSVKVTVNKAVPALALTSSSNPAILTSTITFTGTVTSAAGTPTGSIGFYDGTVLLSTVAISNGKAAYTTSSLATGTHSITAVYSGDANFANETSGAVAESVQDFTFGTPSGGTPSQTTPPGGTATYGFTIQAQNAPLTTPVVFSALGLPSGATTIFNPPSIIPGLTASTFTMTIQTPKPKTVAKLEGLPTGAPLFLGVLLLPFARKLRRNGKKLARVLLLLIVAAGSLVGMAGLNGCGGSSGFFTQAPQTYTITVTATCQGVPHSTNVLLTVE